MLASKQSSSSPTNLVIFGAPGSGKGTACSILKEMFGIVHLSTGDLLRDRINQGDELGNQVQETIRRGQFVDDSVIYKVLRTRLDNDPQCAQRGFILDGFPRTMRQARMLDEMLAQLGTSIHLAIQLDVSDEVVQKRIAGRLIHRPSGRTYHVSEKPPLRPMTDDVTGEPLETRADDTLEALRERLADFKEKTLPVVDLYDKKQLLIRVELSEPHPTKYQPVIEKIKRLVNRRC